MRYIISVKIFFTVLALYIILSTYQIALFVKLGFSIREVSKNNSTVKIRLQETLQTIYVHRHGGFGVVYNVVKALKMFTGNESITVTTTADFTYLDNLITLVKRWKGPISCSLFAPGSDYYDTLEAIHYLRECTTPLIKDLVTFHIYFPINHIPIDLISHDLLESFQSKSQICNQSLEFGQNLVTYRKIHQLLFHINVGRNIARETAKTHYVFPLDIELYPTTNAISEFMKLIADKNSRPVQSPSPKIFVFPIFELSEKVTRLPDSKKELAYLLKKKLADTFHVHICPLCHEVPNQIDWIKSPSNPSSPIFSSVKRIGMKSWEPFYIGTNKDPEFDERITWEGRHDKQLQAYVLCLMDYDFIVLRNSFLVHRPGIIYFSGANKTAEEQMHVHINNTILPELDAAYGNREGCTL